MKKPLTSDFTAAVTVHSDFGAQEEEICHYFHIFPFSCHAIMGADTIICFCFCFCFLIVNLSRFFHSLPSTSSRGSLVPSSLLSAIRVGSSTCLRLLPFLSPILIPACNSSSLTFLMMCSVYRLNKQSESRHPCHTPFLILNQSVVPYRILTVDS